LNGRPGWEGFAVPLKALFSRDDGSRNIPGIDTSWELWISATRTRNFVNEDPLLDWLELYGEAKGFKPDESDPRTDFSAFVMEKGTQFEQAVLQHLDSLEKVTVIAQDRNAARNEDSVRKTWEALASGARILAQAPIWNPEFGILKLRPTA
jgi:hypothetical protein